MLEELAVQAGKLGKQLGDLTGILSTSPHKEKPEDSKSRVVISPQALLEHDDGKEAILQALHAQYYQPTFDSLGFELQHLPPTVDDVTLEAVCEARTSVLEVRLPACVLTPWLRHTYTWRVM